MSIEQDIRKLLESAKTPETTPGVVEETVVVIDEELSDDQIVEGILALDELSKEKLSAYVDSAKNAVAKGANRSAHISRRELLKRIRGVAKANAKLKEQEESLEVFALELEEDEQITEELMAITELSRDTLKSYVNKAAFDYVRKTTQANGKPSEKLAGAKSMKNRIHGIAVANAKLKEHAEILESLEMDEELTDDQIVEKEETVITVDVTQDVDALLNGEDQLTEEFKTKAATIFEAAVVTRVKEELSKLEEGYETKLQEEVALIKEGLIEKVDGYLNHIVEQWIIDNEIALTNGVKLEVMENFINGMKNVFVENYIDVPEEKFDVIASMKESAEAMETKLNESEEKFAKLNDELNSMKRVALVAEAIEGLTEVQKDKFNTLAEELTFEDEVTFKGKLKTIRESYFSKKPTTTLAESFITEEQIEEPKAAKKIDPAMSAYLSAIK